MTRYTSTSGSDDNKAFNPFTDVEPPFRRSRWDASRPYELSRDPGSSQTGSKPLTTQPIPIPQPQTKRLSFGGPALQRNADLEFRSYDWSDSDTDSLAGDSALYDDTPFPMENDSRSDYRVSSGDSSFAKRPGSRSGPEHFTLPPVTSPYSQFKPQQLQKVSFGSSQSAYRPPSSRRRKDSFTSANPAFDLDDLYSTLPTYQSLVESTYPSNVGPVAGPQPVSDSKGSNLVGGSRLRSASEVTATPPTPVTSTGAARIVGFDVPVRRSPQPDSPYKQRAAAKLQHLTMGYAINPGPAGKRKASFYIDDRPQSYGSSSSFDSATPGSSGTYHY